MTSPIQSTTHLTGSRRGATYEDVKATHPQMSGAPGVTTRFVRKPFGVKAFEYSIEAATPAEEV